MNLNCFVNASLVFLAIFRYCQCAIAYSPQQTTETSETYISVPRALYASLIQCVNSNPGNTLEELKQKIEELVELSKTQSQQNDMEHRQSVLEGKIDTILGERNQIFQYYQVLGEVKSRVEHLEEQNDILRKSVQNIKDDNRRLYEENTNLTNTIKELMTSNFNDKELETLKEESITLRRTQDEIGRSIGNVTDKLESLGDSLDFIRYRFNDYGNVYVRWGKKSCGGDSENNSTGSTELIYAGQVAGSDYQSSGAAVNYLCLPNDPIWDEYDIGQNPNGLVYGATIDVWKINIPDTPWDQEKYNRQGVYCAVCQTRGRSHVVMIPGRNECYPGWTEEYHGYLSAGHRSHTAASEYQCLDRQPDIHPISKHVWHKIFYSVEAVCDGPLSCPPYVNGKEITCVVCSK